ncbi:MAG: GDSL-type esterase/lipase family protein [Draconibacterium sp.]
MKKLFLILLLFFALFSTAQDPARFKDEINELVKKEYNFDSSKKLVVFAGSSSIRMWKDVQSYFPEFNVINNGFGGSHFSDLLFYYNELILTRKPDILFIYEGDNDIADSKTSTEVMKQAKELVAKIRKDLPETRLLFISPKPSLAREKLKEKYLTFNNKLERYCNRKKQVDFVNVWTPMCNKNGNILPGLFIEDGLHMNKKGYEIWAVAIRNYLE